MTNLRLEDLDLQGHTLAERVREIALLQDPVRADILKFVADENDAFARSYNTALERLVIASKYIPLDKREAYEAEWERKRNELHAQEPAFCPRAERDEPVEYDIGEAVRIANLWRAGKMIGGDEDGVRNALLAEIERLRALPRGAATVRNARLSGMAKKDFLDWAATCWDESADEPTAEPAHCPYCLDSGNCPGITANRPTEPRDDWQPIATAPKDGMHILAYFDHDPVYRSDEPSDRMAVVRWSGEYTGWSMPGIGGLSPVLWKPLVRPVVNRT